jgi:hypothetical protein
MRDFTTHRNSLQINGRPVFLRGRIDCCFSDETFIGRVQVAHYGAVYIPDAKIKWDVTDGNDRRLASGACGPVTIQQGNVVDIDMFALPLADVSVPQKLQIMLAIDGTPYRNQYPVWVYPAQVDTAVPDNVLLTDAFQDRAWWHLVKNSRPIILDDTPDEFRPTVQVIDNIARNHKLGLIAETKVGPGRLLICAIDLLGHQDEPASRQLLHSLLRYVGSDDFAPQASVDVDVLQDLLP